MTDTPPLAQEIDLLRAENERLREALKPFADACDAVGLLDGGPLTPTGRSCGSWEHPVSCDINLGHYEDARTALTTEGTPND